MNEKQAFFEICAAAKPAHSSYVSLYVDLPYYGGPEEGGWWGHDDELVAYHECSTDEEAKTLAEQVRALAEKLTGEAKDDFNRRCRAECEWVEQRDPMADVDDYFPEVNGEERYWVTVEERPGEHAHQGSRHYE
jgi:hypothetical protein